MKKIYFTFLVLFTMLQACSDDDNHHEKFVRPEVPGVDLDEGEIHILFSPTTANSTFVMTVESKIEGKKVRVNWGTDDKLYEYDPGEIRFEFPEEVKDYLISIYDENISLFDISDEIAAKRIKKLYLGPCPELMKFGLYIYNNIYENLDFSQCPQFEGPILLYVNTLNFDFEGLKHFRSLELYTNNYYEGKNIILKDLNAENIHLNIGEGYNSLHIDDCPNLEGFSIYASYNFKEFDINAPNLSEIRFNGVGMMQDFDLSKMPNLETAALSTVKLLPGKKVIIDNPNLNIWTLNNYYDEANGITSLDFSKCVSLSDLRLYYIGGLEEYNISNLTNLKFVSVASCGNLPDYEYTAPAEDALGAGFNYQKTQEDTSLSLPKYIALEAEGLNVDNN